MSRPLEADLQAGVNRLGLALSGEQITALLDYQALLGKWNQVYNLTAVRDPAEMLTHHLLDSLSAVPPLLRHLQAVHPLRQSQQELPVQQPQAQMTAMSSLLPPLSPSAAPALSPASPQLQLLDVGSGGGLPGVVFAICCPDLQITCVDTVAKKAAFVQQAAAMLRLPNLRGLHARVETVQQPYDVVSSRAFASLADFTGWSRAALAEQGVWLAMKGKHPADELAALPADVQVFHVEPLQVPLLAAERCLVWMRPTAAVAVPAQAA